MGLLWFCVCHRLTFGRCWTILSESHLALIIFTNAFHLIIIKRFNWDLYEDIEKRKDLLNGCCLMDKFIYDGQNRRMFRLHACHALAVKKSRSAIGNDRHDELIYFSTFALHHIQENIIKFTCHTYHKCHKPHPPPSNSSLVTWHLSYATALLLVLCHMTHDTS